MATRTTRKAQPDGTLCLTYKVKVDNATRTVFVPLEHRVSKANKANTFFAPRDASKFSGTITGRRLSTFPTTLGLVLARLDETGKAKPEILDTLGNLEGIEGTAGATDTQPERDAMFYRTEGLVIDGTEYRGNIRATMAPKGGVTFWARGCTFLVSWKAGQADTSSVSDFGGLVG